jgi:hypothetical protein
MSAISGCYVLLHYDGGGEMMPAGEGNTDVHKVYMAFKVFRAVKI